jgi:hypothetical protein
MLCHRSQVSQFSVRLALSSLMQISPGIGWMEMFRELGPLSYLQALE